MNNLEMYEHILKRIESDLLEYEYKRSGKNCLFYRYSADKKVGCAIEMQKSVNNGYGYYSFTFNIICISLDELHDYDYYNDKITLSALRTSLHSIDAMRLGVICHGWDYWWELTEDILNENDLSIYYETRLRDDIKKGAVLLEEITIKKEKRYQKEPID